jgi:hypothetical protein
VRGTEAATSAAVDERGAVTGSLNCDEYSTAPHERSLHGSGQTSYTVWVICHEAGPMRNDRRATVLRTNHGRGGPSMHKETISRS